MPFRDLLRKRDKIAGEATDAQAPPSPVDPPESDLSPEPVFRFIRTTTTTEEIVAPPSFKNEPYPPEPETSENENVTPKRRSLLHFRSRSRTPTKSVDSSDDDRPNTPGAASDGSGGKRLSSRLDKLHIRRPSSSRSVSLSSVRVPPDLPEIDQSGAEGVDTEAEWEKRATLLAERNAQSRDDPQNGGGLLESTAVDGASSGRALASARPSHQRKTSDLGRDVDIQEAIRLHEAGELNRATTLFAILADPTRHNSPLAQVLYGLSLRHGWGCTPDPTQSLHYLSLAASNSATIESAALSSGEAKGGLAKGELVLAIFELGNSFRYGWGCEKDSVAARRYYETAAELGDTDAMSEVAWCYLDGYGGKKDKWRAAKFLRMAEAKGVKRVGDSWIWKEKYNTPPKEK